MKSRILKNKKGQGLIEYLILVALMGVATIGIVRVLNQNVKAQFANVIYGLQGGKMKRAEKESVQDNDFKKSDFSNFMNGTQTQGSKSHD